MQAGRETDREAGRQRDSAGTGHRQARQHSAAGQHATLRRDRDSVLEIVKTPCRLITNSGNNEVLYMIRFRKTCWNMPFEGPVCRPSVRLPVHCPNLLGILKVFVKHPKSKTCL